jgi:hypothetical protein
MRGYKYSPVYDPREYKYINIGDSDFYSTENLKQDKSADYYDEAAHASASLAFKNWAMNRGGYNQPLFDALEVIKEKNPSAYYTEQIKLLGRQAGWLYGQNDPTSANTYIEQVKNIVPDAIKAGISGDQISSLFNQNVALSSEQNQKVIAGEAANQKSFGLESTIRGLLPIATLAIGGPMLDAALAAGTAASAAGTAGAGGSYAGIPLGGAFAPTAGSGASFALPAAAGAGGSIGGINVGGAFTPTAGSGASFTLPGSAGLMGPTYAELGVTGVEGGLAGPTYGELGYTGLNNAEAIAAADAASQSFSAADVLKNANRAKKIADLLKQSGSQVGKSITANNIPTANQWTQQATQNMAQATPEQFGGLYQMNQNPFTFANPLAAALKGKDSTGYDVSGTGGTTLKSANLAKLLA